MLALILDTGLYLMYSLSFLPLRRIVSSFKLLWKNREKQGESDVAPFNAIMALPKLLALILLSPVVFRLTKEHFKQ